MMKDITRYGRVMDDEGTMMIESTGAKDGEVSQDDRLDVKKQK